jgi:hypothetical protein
MAFRAKASRPVAQGEELTAAMRGIGMQFATSLPPLADAAIEPTLVAAATEAMDREDFRVADVLVTWLGVHGERVVVERLKRLLDGASPAVLGFLAGIAHWQRVDPRWKAIGRLSSGRRIELTPGARFNAERRGEDPRFAESPLIVPDGVLRGRAGDVLPVAELARVHRAYHWRVVMGPMVRADAWAVLEAEPALSAAGLARAAGLSYATAWAVRRDFELLRAVEHSLR